MSSNTEQRVDEVSKYYKPVDTVNVLLAILFWVSIFSALVLLYAEATIPPSIQEHIQTIFIILVVGQIVLSLILKLYLTPKAERERRKQLLSDAFGVALSNNETSLYYNNAYSASLLRLGANTMENAFFSKEIAKDMLKYKRIITAIYLIAWLFAVINRDSDLAIITWATQIIFSGQVMAQWVTMETLRFRCNQTYEQLYAHFLHGVGENTPEGIATILDAFTAYESTKAVVGINLSTKTFGKLNDNLTREWHRIRTKLKMEQES